MPGSFIAALVFVVLAAIALLIVVVSNKIAHSSKNEDSVGAAVVARGAGKVGIVVFTALSALLLFVASANIVPTKNVGVVTSFGKPTGYLGNGLRFTAPWSKVTYLDGTIQTDSHQDDESHKNAIPARLASNSTARVNATVAWRIKDSAAPQLFQDYRGDDPLAKIKENLVTRELTTAINEVLATFNPIIASGTDGTPASGGVGIVKYAQEITDKMRAKVSDRIDILSVTVPTISFDEKTQESINKVMAEYGNTASAAQRAETANKEATANERLAASLRDPNVLRSKCLDVVREKGGAVLGCLEIGAAPTTPIR